MRTRPQRVTAALTPRRRSGPTSSALRSGRAGAADGQVRGKGFLPPGPPDPLDLRIRPHAAWAPPSARTGRNPAVRPPSHLHPTAPPGASPVLPNTAAARRLSLLEATRSHTLPRGRGRGDWVQAGNQPAFPRNRWASVHPETGRLQGDVPRSR